MMDEFFSLKIAELPRPESWMPGPPALWASREVDDRIITIDQMRRHLETRAQTLREQEIAFVTSSDIPDDDKEKPSAVLVPFLTQDNVHISSVLVTTRTTKVSSHKGQVSFPGGRIDETDQDVIATALREMQEEINRDPSLFEVIGVSTPTTTRTRTAFITPVVGVADQAAVVGSFDVNDEVEKVHIVDIASLTEPDAYWCEVWDFGYASPTIHFYRVYDREQQPVFIWGATAHILTDLLHCLTPARVH